MIRRRSTAVAFCRKGTKESAFVKFHKGPCKEPCPYGKRHEYANCKFEYGAAGLFKRGKAFWFYPLAKSNRPRAA